MPVAAPLTVAVPLLVAAVLAATGAHLPRQVTKAVALTTAVATAVVQFVDLVQSWDHGLDHWFGGWTTSGHVAVGIVFSVSPPDALIACTVGVLTVAALAYAWRGLPDPGHLFYVLMLTFLAGLSGFAVSGDLFNMFVFFELLSTSGYALCGYRNTSSPVVQGALNFAIINSIGAFCVLMGIALIYGRTGALNLAEIGARLTGHAPDGLVVVSFVLIVVGFLVKAGAVPFHFWLSDAYAVAAAPVGALYAGIMSDVGYHAISRVYDHAYAGALGGAHLPAVRDLLVGVGVATALVGAVMCYLQADIKRQLAFLVISHGGIFCIGIGLMSTAGLAGSTLYVAADGMFKGALFLVIGYVVGTLDETDELRLRGQGRFRTELVPGVVLVGCAVGLAAAPGTGTWLSAALIARSATSTGWWWLPVVMVVATALTAGTVLRAAARLFLGWGPDHDPALTGRDTAEPTEGDLAERGHGGWLVSPATVLTVIGLGLAAIPTLAARAVHSAGVYADFRGYLDEVLHDKPPVAPVQLPHVAFHAGEWAYGGATLAGALLVAAVGLWWPRLPAAGRGVARRALPATSRLKALHSGEVGDYAMWLGAGAVVYLVVAGATFR